jgi:hypothetical protein
VRIALLLVAGIGLFVLGAYRVRVAVVGALLVAVFEGVFRKWIIPDLGQSVYFAKDILLLGGCVGLFIPRLVRREPMFDRHPANPFIFLLLVLGLCQLANPALANLRVGLFGLKAYLLDVPLLYLVPKAFPTVAQLRRFWTVFLVCAAIPAGLGVLQFSAPADSELNRYAWADEMDAESVSMFGDAGRVRITGTFSYISGYAVYLTVVVLMVLPVMLAEGNRWIRGATCGVLVLALGNLLMTGSRGPFVTLAGAAAVLLVLGFSHGAAVGSRAALGVLVVLPLTVVLTQSAFPDAWASFFERVSNTEDVEERLIGIVSNPGPALDPAGVFGYGIGSTHQAAKFLIPDGLAFRRPPDAEGEWERIILELGPIGFGLVVVIRILVLGRLWRTFATSRDPAHRWFVATALLFAAASIPGNLVFNHTASVFYWFFAGVALISDKTLDARSSGVASLHRQSLMGRDSRADTVR